MELVGQRPSICSGSALRPSHRLLRPLLTSRSGSTPSPFRTQGEISPGKNALLRCTTAGSTPLPFDHESFAVIGPLALVSTAFYPVLVHRPAASLHASSPHSVALMQSRFTSLVVINSRWDFHPQECAHAGRTNEKAARRRLFNSNPMIVDQAASNAGFAFRRYAMKPMPAKPRIIIAHVEGSGTAEMLGGAAQVPG